MASCLTRIINAIQDAALVHLQPLRADDVTQRLSRGCDVVCDGVLPGLVQAVRQTVMRPHSRVVQTVLVATALNAVEVHYASP